MDRPEDAKSMKFSDPSDFSIFNNLDEGLLVEILARLPSSRAAMQLKLVCKSWCSLISSRYFVTVFNHLRHDLIHPSSSSSSSGCFIFQSPVDPNWRMLRWGYTHPHDAAAGDFHSPDFSFLPCPQRSIRLNASCADLILCSTLNSTSHIFQPVFYYVCNMLTKQWAALPPAPQLQLERTTDVTFSTGILFVPAPCSLCSPQCVVGQNYGNNFMVARIGVIPATLIHPQFEFKAQLFSSEEGEWKSVVISSPRAIRFRASNFATLVPYKGMLHWLVSGCVLVYDPYNCPERFCRVIDTVIDTPAGVAEREQRPRTLGLFQDRLRVTHVCLGLFQNCLRVTDLWGIGLQDPVYYIWELEDYNMGKWSLVHKIRLRTNPRVLRDLLPHLDPKIRDTEFSYIDPKTRDTGFSYIDGNTFCWNNSSEWWIAKGVVHWITHQCWPTPIPPIYLPDIIADNENTVRNS
nr:putative F-box/kelch-repeat protein At1g15680 [Ipomoea batatas]